VCHATDHRIPGKAAFLTAGIISLLFGVNQRQNPTDHSLNIPNGIPAMNSISDGCRFLQDHARPIGSNSKYKVMFIRMNRTA